ncbi:hypothetical protein IWW48_002193 [Coemansia sp. RSA 1200]|nr:hypothetical protein IWW48_002193 [Coemansia sp. RSA 1200]
MNNNTSYIPKTFFETPEGKWTLVSEFTTEEAANQFTPHIARDISGDDLGMSASGTEGNNNNSNNNSNNLLLPSTPPAVSSGLRFSAASMAMATGGVMLSDATGSSLTAGSAATDGTSTAAAAATTTTTSGQPLSAGPGGISGASGFRAMYSIANRPTHVSVFRTSGHGSTDKHSETVGSESAGGAPGNTSEQAVGSGKSHGFRQGLLNFSKGSNQQQQQQQQHLHGKGIVTKSTSAYVQRIVSNENLAKWIVGDNAQTTYFLFNSPRSMTLVGIQPEDTGETLARLDLATNTPLCHDVNGTTRSENRLDVVMGFVNGNIIWYEPISGKYARLNKNSGYTPAIMCVRWIPHSDNLFMAGTADGCVMVLDRTKDEFCVPPQAAERVSSANAFVVAAAQKPRANPVSFWKVGNKPITSIAFSPDCQHVAVASEDGALRIVDYLNEVLEDVYPSYFGGLTCCAWSDDSKYIVAGGKDDMLTVWSYSDQKTIVARCQGHESWVRDVAFDPMGHQDENTYRFMSVGEDARLLIWDFSLAALHRPRAPLHRTAATRPDTVTADYHCGSTSGSAARLSVDAHLHGRPDIDDTPSGVVHGRAPQGSVAVLQPLMSEVIHDAVVCSLQFCQDLLVTACRRGVVKAWKRPAAFDFSSLLE